MGIPESLLLHLQASADDLLNGWQTYKIMHVPFSSIDATLVKKDGIWNLYHRDIVKGQKGVNTFRMTTDNLDKPADKWKYMGPVKGDVNDIKLTGYGYQEAPYAFFWERILLADDRPYFCRVSRISFGGLGVVEIHGRTDERRRRT